MRRETLHPAVAKWFACWESGDIASLPVTEDFAHTSPFGTIQPKARYLEVVGKNPEDFLGCEFTIHSQIAEGHQICVRYDMTNERTNTHLSVAEWYVLKGDLISEIHAYYNIGDASLTG